MNKETLLAQAVRMAKIGFKEHLYKKIHKTKRFRMYISCWRMVKANHTTNLAIN